MPPTSASRRFGWSTKNVIPRTRAIVADILQAESRKGGKNMAKTKEKPIVAADALRPYVQRAMTDPELRDDLLAAFATARTLYGQLSKGKGVKARAEKVSEKDFQKDVQELIAGLTDASERLQGKAEKKRKKSHKARNRFILLTGTTLAVLYNPWTGQSTRDWIMERVAGSNGAGIDELEELQADLAADAAAAVEATEAAVAEATAGNGSES
jgi:hypothetical protein